MKLIGKGKNGKAYLNTDNTVTKITKSKLEYDFALFVIKNKPEWFCKVFSAEKISTRSYRITKELVTAIETMGFVDIEIEDNHRYTHYGSLYLIFAWCRKGLSTSLLKNNMQFLKSKEDRDVAKFIIKNEKSILKSDIDIKDIWCNVGYNKKNQIVIFDADTNR